MEEESELFDDVQGLTVHAAIGYFIASYSSVELALTALLSALVKATDYNAFHTLTKGLDGRAKVQRFKELCKQKNLFPENSALKMRLDLYDTKITNLRNLVAHCMIIIQDDGVPGNPPVFGGGSA